MFKILHKNKVKYSSLILGGALIFSASAMEMSDIKLPKIEAFDTEELEKNVNEEVLRMSAEVEQFQAEPEVETELVDLFEEVPEELDVEALENFTVKSYDDVPLMFQTDYPGIRFGGGSVATSGCGISCLAMVSTYMTDELHTPGELGRKYNIRTLTNAEKMEKAADDLDLRWDKSFSWPVTKQKLREGHVCIALMNEESCFTSGGHFIVIEKITPDGKFWVKDPYQPNYKKWGPNEGYFGGFREGQILQGLSGCWVFETKEEYKARHS